MIRSICYSILLGAILFFYEAKAQELTFPVSAEKGWKAGVARVVITPPEYMWMAGYAARDKPADGKLHDLWVKALALEDEEGNLGLLITSDIIGFSRELSQPICSRLQTKFKLERKDILLSSSHTHSGPVLNNNLYGIYPPFDEKQRNQVKQYQQFLEAQVLIAAERAINSLSPSIISSGVGISRFAVNRRESGWEGDVLYSPDVKGPSDHSVPVIKITDVENKLVAVVFGYACHATSLSINKWSGDYPGFAQIELERIYPGTTAMFVAGFGADQNPFPRGGVLQSEQYGKELAISVERVLKGEMIHLSPSLMTVYQEIELDIAPPPDQDELEKVIESGADWEKRWAMMIKEKQEAGEELKDSYPYYPVQEWRVGEQTVIVLGGEVVVDYALALRKLLGNNIILIGYSNDVMTYIPSERVLKEGGYEGKTSMWVYGHRGSWEPGIEEKIIKEVVRLVDFCKNQENDYLE
jgi:hypothetical protein